MNTNRKEQKVYAFIDATNIIYSTASLGWKVDFKKLGKYLRERFNTIKILYYAGVDSNNVKQLKFYEKLQQFGFELRLVPVKTFSDGRIKADVDSRMTFEMMLLRENCQRLIVFTGDGDYYWVLEHLKKSKDIILFGSGRSIARELKQLLGGNVTDLNLIRHVVEFRQKNEADAFEESASRCYGNNIAKKHKKVKKI